MSIKIKYAAYAGAAALALAGMVFSLAYADSENTQQREAHAVGSTLEVHISDNGKVLVRGAKVTGVSGSTINATVTWGSVVLSWAVNTNANTELLRRFGGQSALSEISAGDYISFKGSLVTDTASPITVNAGVVKDWSIQKARATFNGTVKSVDATAKSFVLTSEERGDITVTTSDSTKIKKGAADGTFADITVGAKVMASGLYDNAAKTLAADSVKIQAPKAVRTTLEGTIKTIGGTTAPATIVVTVGDKDYTVNVAVDTSVLNSLWLKTTLSALKVGDKLRVYGTVNPDLTVDATVVRDTSIK